MRFNVIAEPQADFNKWVDGVKKSSPKLTDAGYKELSKPGTSDEKSFSAFPPDLFDSVVAKNGGADRAHDMNMSKPDTNVDTKEMSKLNNMSDMSDMPGMDHAQSTDGNMKDQSTKTR
jgi:heme/copper-type cytochrome/quinol oxidase subunit 2